MIRAARGRLRIHGGEARGRRLETPPGIRPSQGVVKEAIFNSLGGAVAEARVLDLFAGSGALGLEALSRGAATVTFVERDERAAAAIRRNLETLGWAGRARVARAGAESWLGAHAEAVAGLTLVLLDPPYNDAVLDRVLAQLDRLVGGGCQVVAEHARRRELPALRRLRVVRVRNYGDTVVTTLAAG